MSSAGQSRRRSASLQTFDGRRIPLHEDRPPMPFTEPSFTCTICWQPQYTDFAPNTLESLNTIGPKLLGTSARVVCKSCWCAVLDLSICWVCGDCIVRGDDVVSLGWCFWHRGCFGCLICNARLEAPSPCKDIGHGRKWRSLDESENRGERSSDTRLQGRCAGVELQDIPLCLACEEQTRDEGEAIVLARGLDNVTKFDGGLCRSRLDLLSEGIPRRASRRAKIKGATGFESELERFINRSSDASNGLRVSDVSEAYCSGQYLPLRSYPGYYFSEDGSTEECPIETKHEAHIPPQRATKGKGRQVDHPDPDARISRTFSDELDTPPRTPPLPHSFSATPPIAIPRPNRSATSRISFAESEHDSVPLRAHTFDSLYSSSPKQTPRPPLNRYPTPFPRINRPALERSDSPSNYFNRGITTGSRTNHSSETVDGMLTLAQFAEHTNTLRKSNTLPHTKLVKAPALLDVGDLHEDFGTGSPTSPFSERYEERTPEPIAEMVERRKRDYFRPSMTLVPEDPNGNVEWGRSGGRRDRSEDSVKEKVVVDGRRSCM